MPSLANDNPDEKEDWKFERGAKEIGFEFGFAPMQPTFFSGKKEYDTAGRKLAMGSFRWGRVIGTKKGITYQYFFDVIPVAIAIKNEVRGIDADSKTRRQYRIYDRPARYLWLRH